jgi:hypothetical protein
MRSEARARLADVETGDPPRRLRPHDADLGARPPQPLGRPAGAGAGSGAGAGAGTGHKQPEAAGPAREVSPEPQPAPSAPAAPPVSLSGGADRLSLEDPSAMLPRSDAAGADLPEWRRGLRG